MDDLTWVWTKRYVCRKGHAVEGATAQILGLRQVLYCPHCYLDLIERECGGLEEVFERNCAEGADHE